jgi:hypothetical protein
LDWHDFDFYPYHLFICDEVFNLDNSIHNMTSDEEKDNSSIIGDKITKARFAKLSESKKESVEEEEE